eukprot:139966-Amorphochlora_amoeboformis.AAC.1
MHNGITFSNIRKKLIPKAFSFAIRVRVTVRVRVRFRVRVRVRARLGLGLGLGLRSGLGLWYLAPATSPAISTNASEVGMT